MNDMTILGSQNDSPAAIRDDCIPRLFDQLSNDAQKWLLDVFPSDSTLIPVVMARQEMAGHVDLLRPPDLLKSAFQIARIGETTFDLQGQLIDLSGRTVARSNTVFAVTNRVTTRVSSMPLWLARTLKQKADHV